MVCRGREVSFRLQLVGLEWRGGGGTLVQENGLSAVCINTARFGDGVESRVFQEIREGVFMG